MLKTKNLTYQDNEVQLEGYVAYDDEASTQKPIVLVCHDWSGKNEFACQKAEQLAELGFIGFAIDMFGKGKIGTTKEEKTALIQPLLQDRKKLQQRILAGLAAAKTIDAAHHHDIAAIGFCFGGLCVLDLARSGADVKGVVSFHGLLHAPENRNYPLIKAKLLVLHGFADPMVTPDQITAFGEEMTQAKADWQMHIYGNVMHAFTNPNANDPGFGTVYDKTADLRSLIAMKVFFQEILSKG